tara:strand:- start:6268 stop:6528 length:261 start_codon:yes stop_codon:yes gene_type:complete
MNKNDLIAIVKNKLNNEFVIEQVDIEDKSFLHKNHQGNQEGKFHLKLTIRSNELKNLTKIESSKKVYKVLRKEMSEYIHSLQILIT